VTWYAQQLIADAVPGLLDELARHPTFSRGLFHVRDLAGARTTKLEVQEVMITATGSQAIEAPAERGPRLPPAGLLFVRELCDLGAADRACEWFGDDAIAWGVEERADRPALALDRAAIAARLRGEARLPPAALLGEAKRLAVAHRAAVTWFSTFFWGGTQEVALAWVFDPASELEVAYTYCDDDDRRGHGDDYSAWRLDVHGARRITQGDPLSLALVHHGLLVHLNFIPHHRSFPWETHRVPAGADSP
jgi:hypothetical protein